MRNACGVNSFDSMVDGLRGERSAHRLKWASGTLSYDLFAGSLNGRTSLMSMATLVELAKDNNFLVFPVRIPIRMLEHLTPPFIVCASKHFKTFKHNPILNMGLDGPWFEDEELGTLRGEIYAIIAQEPPASMVLSVEEARMVKGAKSYFKRVASIVGDIPRQAGNLVTNPSKTIQQAGQGLGQAGTGIMSIFGGGQQAQPKVDLGIPAAPQGPVSPAGMAASGAITSGLQGGVLSQLTPILNPILGPAFQQLDQAFKQRENEVRQRYAQTGLTRSGDMLEALGRLDQERTQSQQQIIGDVVSRTFNTAAQVHTDLVRSGVALEQGQLNHILGLTGLKAEEAALRMGLEQAQIREARERFQGLLSGVLGLGGLAAGVAIPGIGPAVGLAGGQLLGGIAGSMGGGRSLTGGNFTRTGGMI